jgi:hypothetical protein
MRPFTINASFHHLRRFTHLFIEIYSGAFLAFWALSRASGRENRWVHIRRDLSIVLKENTAVFVLQTELRFLYWKFDKVRP